MGLGFTWAPNDFPFWVLGHFGLRGAGTGAEIDWAGLGREWGGAGAGWGWGWGWGCWGGGGGGALRVKALGGNLFCKLHRV